MRIVAGSLRGKPINAPDGEHTRPTIDRVREALFSSLYSLLGGFEDAVVLDAFAGSGALGIESLSRGARYAMFYESDEKAARVVRDNLKSCNLGPQVATLVKRDIMAAPPDGSARQFNLVFLDPPYAYDPRRVLAMIKTMQDNGALEPGAVIVYEHAIKSKDEVAAALEEAGLNVRSSKKYGKTGVTTGIIPE